MSFLLPWLVTFACALVVFLVGLGLQKVEKKKRLKRKSAQTFEVSSQALVNNYKTQLATYGREEQTAQQQKEQQQGAYKN